MRDTALVLTGDGETAPRLISTMPTPLIRDLIAYFKRGEPIDMLDDSVSKSDIFDRLVLELEIREMEGRL